MVDYFSAHTEMAENILIEEDVAEVNIFQKDFLN